MLMVAIHSKFRMVLNNYGSKTVGVFTPTVLLLDGLTE